MDKAPCASRIRLALETRNMKQSELCRRTGIPKSAMSQYVNGAFEPKQDRVYIMAKALNVSEAWLMGYDVAMTSHKVEVDEHEFKLLSAYRNQPDLQKAVDRLLGIDAPMLNISPAQSTTKTKVAAFGGEKETISAPTSAEEMANFMAQIEEQGE